MSPFPMRPAKGVETYEPSRAEFNAAKAKAKAKADPVLGVSVLPLWESPVLFLHASEVAPHEVDQAMDEAAYALSQQHQDDLSLFEAELTKALIAKGMPMVFIQPGAPGHQEAMRAARKKLVHDFASMEPIAPCDHAEAKDGCRSCDFILSRRVS